MDPQGHYNGTAMLPTQKLQEQDYTSCGATFYNLNNFTVSHTFLHANCLTLVHSFRCDKCVNKEIRSKLDHAMSVSFVLQFNS